MRHAFSILALACMSVTPSAHAKNAWLGAQIAFPVPGRDVGGNLLGVDAGATFHVVQGRHVGTGLDIAYHYFPASKGYRAGFDSYLNQVHLAAIDGPNYAFKAIQVTPHLRVTTSLGERWSPWVQVGAGCYFVDRNLAATDWTGSYFFYTGPGFKKYTFKPGWNTALGLDAHPSSNITLGIDATYHQIASMTEKGIFGSDAKVPTFTAITAGVHVLYGW